ncbi:zinc finger CCCH domain-containing protein 18-like isoform X3 [Aristolochia californica]|uniref:zinc finger CCCH domain-containing protein 18-like isoform X3 n=1 Tax=Aristolochia californica TaxID=171875 RepID=UPI0035DEB694
MAVEMNMDFPDATKVVFNRISMIEPDHVAKIIGYVLLQDNAQGEMIRLAFGPDNAIFNLVSKVKAELGLSPKPAASTPISPSSINSGPISDMPLQFTPFTPASSRPFSSPATFRVPSPFWEPQLANNQHNLDFVHQGAYAESLGEDYRVHNQGQFLSLEDQLDAANSVGPEFSNNYYYPEHSLGGALATRSSRRSPSLPEFPVKACHYFNKGFCKHGANCRYFHGQTMADSLSQVINLSLNDLGSDDQIFSPGSLERLEMELTELLKSKRGLPVSIASLPMLYFEKYGRNLQADGYLTESQRHGKAGYSLTKLLARLKNSIRLIDRPHGQHSVVLAEDAARYMDYRSDRNDPGVIVAGSHQIYLTFPAESTFSEKDVSDYFEIFGPVEDVRIPSQQKRMFGFVTFVYSETVKQILTKGNPHFVCGARVLVKPYREKARLGDRLEFDVLLHCRKYQEKIDPPMYYPHHFLEMESQLHSSEWTVHRASDNSRLIRKQLIEEHEQAMELERRRLSDLQLAPKPVTQQPYFNYPPIHDFKFTEDLNDFSSADRFSYLLDVLNNGSTNDDKNRHINNNYNDQDSSQGINLPESPFASPIASSISTVI